MIKRIIYFPQNKLSDHDYIRFGIDIIHSKGYEVEVWDFTPVLRPYYFKNYELPNPSKFKGIKVYGYKNKILKDISSLTSSDIIVSMIHSVVSTSFIYKALDESNIKYGYISLTSHPENFSKNFRYVLRLEEIKRDPFVLLSKIFNRFNKYLSPKKYYIASPTFILSGGKKGIEKFPAHSRDKKIDIINAHNLDYDVNLIDILNPEDPIVNFNNYAVYTDMNLPFSMDTSHRKGKNRPSANADTFYPVMRKYFDEFELKLNMNVVIAAHPRSDYSGDKKSLYGDRLVIRNKTYNLIKHAKCVLAHHSTSVSFAVLTKKPVIFLTPNVIKVGLKRRIKFMANNFGQKPLNISINHIPSIRIDPINEDAYKAYKNNYIKMEGTPEKPIWEIFCNYLNSKNYN